MKQNSQYLEKHLKFLLYSTTKYIMKMIHLMTNLRLKLKQPKQDGKKEIEKQNELLTSTLQIEIEN